MQQRHPTNQQIRTIFNFKMSFEKVEMSQTSFMELQFWTQAVLFLFLVDAPFEHVFGCTLTFAIILYRSHSLFCGGSVGGRHPALERHTNIRMWTNLTIVAFGIPTTNTLSRLYSFSIFYTLQTFADSTEKYLNRKLLMKNTLIDLVFILVCLLTLCSGKINVLEALMFSQGLVRATNNGFYLYVIYYFMLVLWEYFWTKLSKYSYF